MSSRADNTPAIFASAGDTADTVDPGVADTDAWIEKAVFPLLAEQSDESISIVKRQLCLSCCKQKYFSAILKSISIAKRHLGGSLERPGRHLAVSPVQTSQQEDPELPTHILFSRKFSKEFLPLFLRGSAISMK